MAAFSPIKVGDRVILVNQPQCKKIFVVDRIETDLEKCHTGDVEFYLTSVPHPKQIGSAVIVNPQNVAKVPEQAAPPVSRAYFEIGDRVYMPNDRPEIVWKIVKIKSRAHGSSKYYLECPPTREWQLNYTLIVSQRDIYHIADRR